MKTLKESLDLERIELDLFRGFTADTDAPRIFGGQVIAQALLAAYQTVDQRLCHSLHAYFIHPGDPKIPILFEVDRARDGGSFTTRRVTAVQHGRQIFNLAASFHVVEQGPEHQSPMPAVSSGPEALLESQAALDAMRPPHERSLIRIPSILAPLEMCRLDRPAPGFTEQDRAPEQKIWMRAREPIPADPIWHQVVLAYASDIALLATSLRPHGITLDKVFSASLDHAIWFHRPLDFNAWHLYALDSPSASGARGFNRGEVFSRDGVLVASMAQEGLLRIRGKS